MESGAGKIEDSNKGGARQNPPLARFRLSAEETIEKIGIMKLNKNIGMILLAVYLILHGLLGFGLPMGPAVFLIEIVALAAGVFILLGK